MGLTVASFKQSNRCSSLEYTLDHKSTLPAIGLDCAVCSVLRPRQHSIGYMGDGFYRSKDPTNSFKVLKEDLQKTKQTTKTTKFTNAQTIIETQKDIRIYNTASLLVYTNMG